MLSPLIGFPNPSIMNVQFSITFVEELVGPRASRAWRPTRPHTTEKESTTTLSVTKVSIEVN